MANFKTRIVFLLTGRLPERDEEMQWLRKEIVRLKTENDRITETCRMMHGFFWQLYETVISAKNLDELKGNAVQIGDRFESTTGYVYDRQFVRWWLDLMERREREDDSAENTFQ